MKYFTLDEIKEKRPYRKWKVFLIKFYIRFIQTINKIAISESKKCGGK